MKSNNKTRYLILGLLSEEPMSGYEIKKIVDMQFSYFWSESYGQIYPELNKMTYDGVIRKLDSLVPSGRRNSCKYEITPEGLDLLKEWLTYPVEKEMIRYELLLKLYFSNLTETDTMIAHIREFQLSHRKQQRLFSMFQKNLEENIQLHDNHHEILMVLHFGQKVWAAYDEWCEETIALLEERKKQRKREEHE